MPAFWIRTANPCHTVQIITACKKMFTNIHDTAWSVEYNLLGMHPIKIKLAVFFCVLYFIDITKISKMLLENRVQNIPVPGKIALSFG